MDEKIQETNEQQNEQVEEAAPSRQDAPRRRPPGLTFPLLLIGLGVIFLLNSMGVLRAPVLPMLFRFWPALLVLIGLDILIGRRSLLGSLLVGALVIALLVGAVSLNAFVTYGGDATPTLEQVGLPIHSEAEEMAATIDFSVGELEVSALPAPADYAAEVYWQPIMGRGLDYSYKVQDGRGKLFITDSYLEDSFRLWDDWDSRMTVGLEPSVPISLTADAGVGEVVLDLSELELESLNADMGVGELRVTLPEAGSYEANLSLGIGELMVVVPDGVEARIESDMGIGETDVDSSRFVRDGDVYVTRGYEGAENVVELTVDVGIGAITVE